MWNSLVTKWNNHLCPNTTVVHSQFDKKELDTLLRLCHPDKHNGKQSANEMTAKLIKLRETL